MMGSLRSKFWRQWRHRQQEESLEEQLATLRRQLALVTSDFQVLKISERCAAQRQQLMVARLAHELRTPLSPLRWIASLLANDDQNSLTPLAAKSVIDRQVNFIARVIDDLVDAMTSNREELDFVPDVLDLKELVLETVSAMRPQFDAQSQQLRVESTCSGLKICGDSVRLIQVFVNLLQNASRYTAAGGSITVSVRSDNEIAEVEVSDNGIGISQAMLTAIFNPYIREQEAEVCSKEGMGIGLALVDEIVRAHGGTVSAFSGGRGFGSRFLVRLPVDVLHTGGSSRQSMM